MAKRQQVAPEVPAGKTEVSHEAYRTPSSIKDLAYMHASVSDQVFSLASWARVNIPGFPKREAISAEDMGQLYAGYALRWQENNPAMIYVREGLDNYRTLLKGQPAPEKAEIVTITADYAMSFTGQAFGSLKKDTPNLHHLVGEVRSKVSSYRAERVAALCRQGAALEAKVRQRGATKDYAVSLKERQDQSLKSAKAARARGDATVKSDARIKAAWAAFWSEYNKAD